MQMAQPEKRIYPSYPQMIKQLFKPMATVNDQLMHAAIGLGGEASELMCSMTMKNTKEEMGDLEFYVEALKQQFNADFTASFPAENDLLRYYSSITLGNVFTNLCIIAGEILDAAKKSWVYNKELDAKRMTQLVITFEVNLEALCRMMDVKREDIRLQNQIKLIGPGGRFESGFYSDGAAIARADKVVSERTFIGSKLS